MLTRRRFLTIAAASGLAPAIGRAETAGSHVETALALGARVTLRIDHPEGPRLARLALDEIRRLESIFSLYRPDSALVRLNRDGVLADPPFELLDCLSLAGAVHQASAGRFDPTVQPLWRAEADATEAGRDLTGDERQAALGLLGWSGLRLDPAAVSLRPGQALTLNGIAQGYIADRVAALLAAEGLTRALIDTGEMVALPEADWDVHLPSARVLPLRGRALATSAPFGMTFGDDGRRSHILDPRSGRPVAPVWKAISISAPSAGLADALATAACLTQGTEDLATLCNAFTGTRIEAAIPA